MNSPQAGDPEPNVPFAGAQRDSPARPTSAAPSAGHQAFARHGRQEMKRAAELAPGSQDR